MIQMQYPPNRPLPALTGKGEFTQVWSGWFRKVAQTFNSAFNTTASGTVTLAKLTTGGTEGSLTIVNGVITTITPST